MSSLPLKLEHFSDVLCAWAYVGQIRVDELEATFGDQLAVEYHFLDVFGDARGKIDSRWVNRGGRAGYAEHIRDTLETFDHVQLAPQVWATLAPASSLSAHVFLCATRLLATEQGSPDAFRRALWRVREAFFRDLIDISQRAAQLEIASQVGLDPAAVASRIDSGEAHAALARDHELARTYEVKMSPTIVLDGGRQHLRGNVGYRVIEANIRELLHKPAQEASWC